MTRTKPRQPPSTTKQTITLAQQASNKTRTTKQVVENSDNDNNDDSSEESVEEDQQAADSSSSSANSSNQSDEEQRQQSPAPAQQQSQNITLTSQMFVQLLEVLKNNTNASINPATAASLEEMKIQAMVLPRLELPQTSSSVTVNLSRWVTHTNEVNSYILNRGLTTVKLQQSVSHLLITSWAGQLGVTRETLVEMTSEKFGVTIDRLLLENLAGIPKFIAENKVALIPYPELEERLPAWFALFERLAKAAETFKNLTPNFLRDNFIDMFIDRNIRQHLKDTNILTWEQGMDEVRALATAAKRFRTVFTTANSPRTFRPQQDGSTHTPSAASNKTTPSLRGKRSWANAENQPQATDEQTSYIHNQLKQDPALTHDTDSTSDPVMFPCWYHGADSKHTADQCKYLRAHPEVTKKKRAQ